MKPVLATMIAILSVMVLTPSLRAQSPNFGAFDDLIGQFSNEQQTEYFSNLDSVATTSFLTDTLNNSGIMDSLGLVLDGGDPTEGLDSLLMEWNAGAFQLDNNLFSFSQYFGPVDSDSLIIQFDTTFGAWLGVNGDLQLAFSTYADSIDLDKVPTREVGSQLDRINGGLSAGNNILLNDLLAAADTLGSDRPGGLHDLFNELFGGDFAIELGYGRKMGSMNYYYQLHDFPKEDPVEVVRLGTRPSFNRLWEAFWYFQVGWTDTQFWSYYDLPEGTTRNQSQLRREGFNLFSLDGAFNIRYNPAIEIGDQVSANLITSLGIEAATHAPSYYDERRPGSYQNLGMTTSVGPQVGAGFAVKVGPVTTSAMATSAFGFVANSPGYSYSSLKLSAEARYENLITIRYEHGTQDWAPNGNKRLVTANQVVISVPVTVLNRP